MSGWATAARGRWGTLQHAIRLLRDADLEHDYGAAWEDWESSGDRAAWERTVADGLTDGSR